MNDHIFSFYRLENGTRIEKRKWWQIFSHDEIVNYESLQRYSVTVSKAEADLILKADRGDYNLKGLLEKFMSFGGSGIESPQLEQTGNDSSSYIATTGSAS